MTTERYSSEYKQLLLAGPFAGRSDPWAETGRNFHQIHGAMITFMVEHLQLPLIELGYFVGREASLLQVGLQSDPDLFVHQSASPMPRAPQLKYEYELAAGSVLAEPGVKFESEELDPELDAILIRDSQDGTLVEIISPSNKAEPFASNYVKRRHHYVSELGINVVELDVTRSNKRLVNHALAKSYPYHIAVHLPPNVTHFIGIEASEMLKRFALPLRDTVIGIDTQPFYNRAYQHAAIALQIDTDLHYREEELPFPSLLTDEQRQQALAAVDTWRKQLTALKNEGNA